jgi:hypothetical protein
MQISALKELLVAPDRKPNHRYPSANHTPIAVISCLPYVAAIPNRQLPWTYGRGAASGYAYATVHAELFFDAKRKGELFAEPAPAAQRFYRINHISNNRSSVSLKNWSDANMIPCGLSCGLPNAR